MGESSEAADRVLNALDGVGAVRKHEVQQAAFVVLKSPDIPSMLIETAYISNPAEERMLRTPAQQQRLADAICGGISGYFRKFPPEGSLFARARAERNADGGTAGARRHLGARGTTAAGGVHCRPLLSRGRHADPGPSSQSRSIRSPPARSSSVPPPWSRS